MSAAIGLAVVMAVLALVTAARRRDERARRTVSWEAVRRAEEDARAAALRRLEPAARRRLDVCSGCDGLVAVMALDRPVAFGLCDCGEVRYREGR